jgi:penicillin-binding protein 2
MRLFGRRRKIHKIYEIAPDEVFLDSSNLPGHNAMQFEGRVERPLSHRSIIMLGVAFVILSVVFGSRSYNLQIVHGASYADISENNTLRRSLTFATRGVIFDRTGRELAWNTPQPTETATSTATSSPYALRAYADMPGLSHIIGYVRYPKADSSGRWWNESYIGVSGSEATFDPYLSGINGSSILETDAHGKVERANIVIPPQNGQDLHLSINADIQSKLYTLLSAHAEKQGFKGGAAVIMDVRTGEVIALTSFPEYDNEAFVSGDREVISRQSTSASKPLLNRAIGGLYAPGSILKPIFAAAALNEKIISPDKQINSTGKITIPNPYDPDKPSIYRDWTVHGWVDMRTALAVSSDEYFYTIGGGYGGQPGLGITRIDQYSQMFGLGSSTNISLLGEQEGVIPTPAWKEQVFGEDDPWRLGNTYHTAIGQFGFQVTPIQAVRFTAAIANGGKLWVPQVLASTTAEYTTIDIPDEYLQIVREGMRMAVTSDRHDATVKALFLPGIKIAAKTGTAQIGAHNEWMNSWNVGFWPADNPHYAYAVVLERAPAGTASGAAPGMQPFFYWLMAEHPEYVQ